MAMGIAAQTSTEDTMRRPRLRAAAIGLFLAATTLPAAAQTAQTSCLGDLQDILTDGTLWQGAVTLSCGGGVENEGAARRLPVGVPFLIGLTLLPERDDYWDVGSEGEVDFPVQVVTLDATNVETRLQFRLPQSQIGVVRGAQIGAWPLSAVRPCVDDRDGCAKYGYALGVRGGFFSECPDNAADGCFSAQQWGVSLIDEAEEEDAP